MKINIHTYEFFGKYGFAYHIGKRWGNHYNKRIAFIAKFLHKTKRGKYFTLINIGKN